MDRNLEMNKCINLKFKKVNRLDKNFADNISIYVTIESIIFTSKNNLFKCICCHTCLELEIVFTQWRSQKSILKI